MGVIFLAAALLVGWGVLIFALAANGGNTLYNPDAYGVCAPSRHATITANAEQPVRYILAELAPPAGWKEPVAIVPAPAVARVGDWSDWEQDNWDDDEPAGVPESALIALLTGQPEPAPVAVPNWPKLKPVEQPAVVEPEPVPLVVNRTAARFAALEVRG